ncbi:MAG: SDR family NAD(P)-dependent oxidoreductase [Salaquimonas sp.]|jgi:NAD(P)-dependent dehydrogenase (short-subunit alcohol dehydrogenase family)|nr:SDR family NAD(P)-dependent oxidoreductase [Salaquimonas sp.]
MKKLQDRIALVTGASRGIGYHAALGFAREGAHVIAVARTVGGLEELDDAIKAEGGAATLVPLDITDYDALDRLGAEIDKRWGRLDILLANAGMLGGLSPLGHIEPKTFGKVFDLNVTANWRLIRSLDPLLRASDAGRAIFLSSGAAHSTRPFWGAYAASKAALEALARVYAGESAKTSIRVVIVDPGAMRTAMRAQAMPGEDPETLPDPGEIVPDLVMLASPQMQENGKIYKFASKKFLTPQNPA